MKKSYLIQVFWLLIPILFLNHVAYSQPPSIAGWHSRSPLKMTENECFNKAQDVLKQAGFTKLFSKDGWSSTGTTNKMTATINCVPCGNGVLVDIGVAHAPGYVNEVNDMRTRLKEFFLGINNSDIIVSEAYYKIIVKHSSKVLDVNLGKGDQANVVQQGWHGGDNQRWKLEALEDGYYKIIAKHSGKVLDVNLGQGDQANVVQQGWHGGANQRWKLEALEDGYYKIIAKHSGKVLDVNLGQGDQANVVQQGWHGGDNQRWKLERIN